MYGSDRIHQALRQRGIATSRKRIARLMRENGLNSRRQRRWKPSTTDSRHRRPAAPNLLRRDFSADAPNEVFYNRQRIHTSIGYTHPTAYEAHHYL